MMIYNLSIACVDVTTIYGMISCDKSALLGFLERYDHEGSQVSLHKHPIGEKEFINIEDPEDVYRELRG